MKCVTVIALTAITLSVRIAAASADDCFGRLLSDRHGDAYIGGAVSEFYQGLGLWALSNTPETDEVINAAAAKLSGELDDAERKLNDGVHQLGPCYGKGPIGSQVAARYEKLSADIAGLRKQIVTQRRALLDRNSAGRSLEVSFENWATKYRGFLSASTAEAQIAIKRISVEDGYGSPTLSFQVSVTDNSLGTILRPHNVETYGYDADSPDVGVTLPVGARLSDSFGNSFKFIKVDPEFFGEGTDEKGIRPDETVEFVLKFADIPVRNSAYVTLSLDPKALGQIGATEFRLPADVFFGSPGMQR
jgi:hypothetical protein